MEAIVENIIVNNIKTYNGSNESELTEGQKGLWFLYKLDTEDTSYNVVFPYTIHSFVDVSRLKKCLQTLFERHAMLRTIFFEKNGTAYQKEDVNPILCFTQVDASNLTKDELANAVNADAFTPFNLETGPTFRVSLYTQHSQKHVLLICVHHIVFDGQSFYVFMSELLALYAGQSLQELNHKNQTYFDYVCHEKEWLKSEEAEKFYRFWKKQISGDLPIIQFPVFKNSSIKTEDHDCFYHFQLDTEFIKELNAFVELHRITLYTLLLAVYALLLSRYTREQDIIIGSPMSGRREAAFQQTLGYFVNVVPIRIFADSDYEFTQYLQQVFLRTREAIQNQRYPIPLLVQKSDLTRKFKTHPLFQTSFVFQRSTLKNLEAFQELWGGKPISLGDLTFEHFTLKEEKSNFPLVLEMRHSSQSLNAQFRFDAKIFDLQAIEVISKNFLSLLRSVISTPHQKLSKFSVLNTDEYNKTIKIWNQTEKEYPSEKTIHALFEEQVERTPNQIALVYENVELTYKKLNERANQLAHYLLKKHRIKPDTLVTLCLERSEVMLISILAVLKARGAYVPIDPHYPQERIDYILEDTKSSILLTDAFYLELIPALAHETKTNPMTDTISSDLAYVIYTSGTTGKPKGVMIEHKGVINTITAIKSLYDFHKGNRFTAFTSYTFDASVSEFWTALFNGGELHLLSDHIRADTVKLSEYMIQHKINHMYLPPAVLPVLPKINYPDLYGIMYAGEPCDTESGKYWSRQCNLFNYYGITEISIHVTGKKVTDGDTNLIGKPIFNMQCFVLDTNLNPLPIGAVGELYLCGEGVARGYLNRPELTAERFITNPFQTETDKKFGRNLRLYKSGDLVRWLPDGNLEYLGRADFQVKIRGFRIELGEIENALLSFRDDVSPRDNKLQGDITQSVVLAKDHLHLDGHPTGNKYLVGYYVSKCKFDDDTIFAYLRSKLPEYMVPTALIHLEKIPLTINGKTDRKALPEPEFTNKETYIAPRNTLEKDVCSIWAEVLGISEDRIGIRDDFFKLGGDSIVSIRLVSHLRQKLNLNINVKDIFNYKTIQNLYESIFSKNTNTKNIKLKTEQGQLSGEVPLLPIQKMFFDNKFIQENHWNHAFIIKIPLLDINQLEDSVQKLVSHYDSFSLRYKKDSHGNIVQYYDHNNHIQKIKIHTLDVTTFHATENNSEFQTKLQEIYTQWQSEFNLETGSLASFGYVYGFSDSSARIHFALHHLIVDAVSWRILVHDLKRIYNKEELGLKATSYRQWSQAIMDYEKSNKSEKSYWMNVVSDYHPQSYNSFIVNDKANTVSLVCLNAQDTQTLLTKCNEGYHTEINDLLLSALAYSLAFYFNYPVNHIVLEGHGREEIEDNIDITQQVGWFTILYPVRLEVKNTLSDTIKCIKNNLRKIPNKGIGYGALFGYNSNLLPQVSFNYLGQFSEGSDSTKKTDWNIVLEQSGISIHPDNQSTVALDINGAVFNGELLFNFSSKLTHDKTAALASHFSQKLKEIIEHTCSLKRTYLTSSDVYGIISQNYLDSLQTKKEIEAVYLANSLQQGFVYHVLSQGDVDDAYRVQIVWEYKNKLNVEQLKKAWICAQQKYPALRLRFAWDEAIVQVVDSHSDMHWNFVDLSTEQDVSVKESRLHEISQSERSLPFDLSQSGLFRVCLIKFSEDLYTCIFTNHHAIMDGWSNPVLLTFIHETYVKLEAQESISFSFDQSYGQSQHYLQEHNQEDLAYLNGVLSEIEARSDLNGLLNVQHKHLKISDYKHILEPQEQTFTIEGELYSELKLFGQNHGVTLNAILQYAWHKVLHIYGNSPQTVVGATISGRNIPIDHIEKSVGLYINTLPLVVDHTKSSNVLELIKSIQESLHELNNRSAVHLAQLQKSGERLFDTIFVYENYPKPVQSDFENTFRIQFNKSIEKLDYPLGIVAYEINHSLILKLKYAAELFDVIILQELISVLNTIIRQIAMDANLNTQTLKYLTTDKYNQSIGVWNQTEKEYPSEKTIHALFEEQVEKTPNELALVYENVELTYKQLNESSNQLAHYLRKTHHIKEDSLVALCLERSEVMLICILAVLKAGGAYVPIDPNYPKERIDYILEDTKSSILLTNALYQELIPELALEAKTNPSTETTSSHLAYVIYTSGTTGKPKGVMLEHTGIINNIVSHKKFYSLDKGKRVSAFTAYTFDASVPEFLSPLLNGGELYLLSEEIIKNPEKLSDYIIDHKINYLRLPPVILSLLPKRKYDSIFGIKYSGESCDLNTALYWSNHYNLYNYYGPTEASISVISKQVKNGDVTILGSPMANVQCFVLDPNLSLLPICAIGELYIGGVGLARGYLNRPDLTAEKFILNPFQTEYEKKSGKNERLYKTGDLVRWTPDGNLEYIGRTDFQVKIRGFRIELGEIENVLLSFRGLTAESSSFDPAVKPWGEITQSVVLAKEHLDQNGHPTGNKYLVAYYVSECKLDEDKIFAYLHSKLPEYMVPTALVHLERIPLTINGKTDRKALPEPKFTNKDTYVAPRNTLEKDVCRIWSELLGIPEDKISIRDHFFKLGGNSILAIKLLAKINRLYESHLKLVDIFFYKTIELLAPKIVQSKDKYQISIKLNNSKHRKNMFMIHPGAADCSVYLSLADKLTNSFSCYGIDSYNIYSESKIDNLNTLATHYLDCIDEIMAETQQTEYFLLGWSLGGKIALEIAALLESRGVHKIKLYLLDTFFTYKKTRTPKSDIKNRYIAQGYDTAYIEKLLSVLDAEAKIMQCELSMHLVSTQILLFKAMQADARFVLEDPECDKYIAELKYNNLDNIVENISQITLVQLHDAYHGNILEKEEELINAISDFDLNYINHTPTLTHGLEERNMRSSAQISLSIQNQQNIIPC